MGRENASTRSGGVAVSNNSLWPCPRGLLSLLASRQLWQADFLAGEGGELQSLHSLGRSFSDKGLSHFTPSTVISLPSPFI